MVELLWITCNAASPADLTCDCEPRYRRYRAARNTTDVKHLSLRAGVSASGAAPSEPSPPATWSGRTVVHRTDRIPRSHFVQQLDDETDAPFERELPMDFWGLVPPVTS